MNKNSTLQNEKTIKQQILEYNNDLSIRSLRENYNRASFFELLSKGRSETVHSAFIKWLLQGEGYSGAEEYSPLMTFLDILIRRDEQQQALLPSAFSNAVLSRKINIKSISTTCEKMVKDLAKDKIRELEDDEEKKNIQLIAENSQDRIDIFVDCDIENAEEYNNLQIIIENKVGSKEGGKKEKETGYEEYDQADQTKRYYLAAHNDKKGEVQIFVYLTPLSSVLLDDFQNLDDTLKCDCKESYIQINYQDILDYIITPLLQSDSLSQRTKVLYEEYRSTLTIPSISDIDLNEKDIQQLLVMASSSEEKEKLCSYLKDYSELIQKSIFLSNRNIVLEDSDKTECQQMMEILLNADFSGYREGKKYAIFAKDVICLPKEISFEEFKKISPIQVTDDANLYADSLNKKIREMMTGTKAEEWTQDKLNEKFGNGVVLPKAAHAKNRIIELDGSDRKKYKFQTAEVRSSGKGEETKTNVCVTPIKSFEVCCKELGFSDYLLLLDFYKKNYRLILAAIKILVDTSGEGGNIISSDEFAKWTEIYTQLTGSTDRTKYKLSIDGKPITLHGVSKRQLVRLLVDKINLNDEMMKDMNDNIVSRMFLIKEKPSDYCRYDGLKIEDGKAKRSTLSESNKDDFDYYVSNQWGVLLLSNKEKQDKKNHPSGKGGNFGKLLDYFINNEDLGVKIIAEN